MSLLFVIIFIFTVIFENIIISIRKSIIESNSIILDFTFSLIECIPRYLIDIGDVSFSNLFRSFFLILIINVSFLFIFLYKFIFVFFRSFRTLLFLCISSSTILLFNKFDI